MRQLLWCAAIAATAALEMTPAAAGGWKVFNSRDRMNDRDVRYAELGAQAPDHGISAVLGLTCSKEMGGRFFTLSLSQRIRGARIGGSYRKDDQPEEVRIFYVSNGRVAFIEAPHFDLLNRKRFRVELQPEGGPALFYEFDLAGLPRVAKSIGCG